LGHQAAAQNLFFDYPLARGEGQRLENLAALALYRQLTFLEDRDGVARSLRYLRNNERA